MIKKTHEEVQSDLKEHNLKLQDMNSQEMLLWGYEKFDNEFCNYNQLWNPDVCTFKNGE